MLHANGTGETALHLAVKHGHVEAAGLLCQTEGACNKSDDWGLTPLHVAAKATNVGIVRALMLGKVSILSSSQLCKSYGGQRMHEATCHANLASHCVGKLPKKPAAACPAELRVMQTWQVTASGASCQRSLHLTVLQHPGSITNVLIHMNGFYHFQQCTA